MVRRRRPERKAEEAPAARLFAAPQHPYTVGLLNAVPRPGMRRGTHPLTPIAGLVPVLRVSGSAASEPGAS